MNSTITISTFSKMSDGEQMRWLELHTKQPFVEKLKMFEEQMMGKYGV